MSAVSVWSNSFVGALGRPDLRTWGLLNFYITIKYNVLFPVFTIAVSPRLYSPGRCFSHH